VALRARDLARLEAFWVDVMGYRVEWRPDPDNVYLTSGTDNLALHRSSADLATGDHQPLDHIGIAVPSPDDVDAWARRVTELGLALATPPRTHRDGARSFYVDDPEGNRIQIIYHAPMSLDPRC
jgi:catechol 2,3-dioxygenase-like lactoylglutathione lyase family enzyme